MRDREEYPDLPIHIEDAYLDYNLAAVCTGGDLGFCDEGQCRRCATVKNICTWAHIGAPSQPAVKLDDIGFCARVSSHTRE